MKLIRLLVNKNWSFNMKGFLWLTTIVGTLTVFSVVIITAITTTHPDPGRNDAYNFAAGGLSLFFLAVACIAGFLSEDRNL